MKLVVFGLSIGSSWGNGHAILLRGVFRALRAYGYKMGEADPQPLEEVVFATMRHCCPFCGPVGPTSLQLMRTQ